MPDAEILDARCWMLDTGYMRQTRRPLKCLVCVACLPAKAGMVQKTGSNADIALDLFQLIYCIYAFITFVAIMLVIFPFAIAAKFSWPHSWRQYNTQALHALGRSLVSFDICFHKADV